MATMVPTFARSASKAPKQDMLALAKKRAEATMKGLPETIKSSFKLVETEQKYGPNSKKAGETFKLYMSSIRMKGGFTIIGTFGAVERYDRVTAVPNALLK